MFLFILFLDASTRQNQISVTDTFSNNRLRKTDVGHLKTGGVTKRITRSKAREELEAEDDCVVVAAHPPGTVSPQLPMCNTPKSLPPLPSVSVAIEPGPAEPLVGVNSIARARRSKQEKLKKIKEERIENAAAEVDSVKVKKKKKEKNASVAVTNVASVTTSSAKSTSTTTTPMSIATQTVSVTATQVSSRVVPPKQFGDAPHKRKSDKALSGSTSKSAKISVPVTKSAGSAFSTPPKLKSDSNSAVKLMSSIQPSTSNDAVSPPADLMPTRPTRSDTKSEKRAATVPVSSSSSSLRNLPSPTPQDAPGPAYIRDPSLHRERVTSRRRSPSLRSPPDHSPSQDRGRSRSRVDHRRDVRPASIPVRATFYLRPGNGVEPQIRDFNLALVSPKVHTE